MICRIVIVCLTLFNAACTRETQSIQNVLPVQVQRAWKLTSTTRIEPTAAHETVRGLGLEEAHEARYSGNGSIIVHVYRMGSNTSAFEALQKWRDPESIPFYKGAYFVTARGAGVDRETLSGFVQALQDGMSVTGV